MAPTAVFVVGPAGSGKSSVSSLLARRLGAALLDKDTVAGGFTAALLRAHGDDPNDRDGAYYKDVVMDLEYATLLALAGDNLRLGRTVVMDAPFGRYLPQDTFLEASAADHDWPADTLSTVVEVVVDGEELRHRLTARGNPRDDWKLAHWEEFWPTASAVVCAWRGARMLRFDNSHAGLPRDEVERVAAAIAEPDFSSAAS